MYLKVVKPLDDSSSFYYWRPSTAMSGLQMSATDNGRHLLLSVVDPKLTTTTTTTHYAPPFLMLILPEHIPSYIPICFTILHALTTTSIYFPLKLQSHAPPWTTVLVFSRATPENTNTKRLSLSLALLHLSVVPLSPSFSSSVNHTSNSCHYLFFCFRTSFPTSCPKLTA